MSVHGKQNQENAETEPCVLEFGPLPPIFNVGEPGAHDQRLRGKSVPPNKFCDQVANIEHWGEGGSAITDCNFEAWLQRGVKSILLSELCFPSMDSGK